MSHQISGPDLTPESDFSHRLRTIGIEAIDGCPSGAQSVGEDSQMLHDPMGHNA